MNRKVIVSAGIALGLGASVLAFGILAYGSLRDLAKDLETPFDLGSPLDMVDSEEDF